MPQQTRFWFDVVDSSIVNVDRRINRFSRRVFIKNVSYMDDLHRRLFRYTYIRTMVATGELRSKLFNKRIAVGTGTIDWVTGYLPTSNQQAYSQEFETDKPVHRNIGEHFHNNGASAKCSREPQDIWRVRGRKYFANPKAMRGALALGISYTYSAVPYGFKEGTNIRYICSLNPLRKRLLAKSNRLAKNVF